jgi:hypothetical protein
MVCVQFILSLNLFLPCNNPLILFVLFLFHENSFFISLMNVPGRLIQSIYAGQTYLLRFACCDNVFQSALMSASFFLRLQP